MVTGGGGPTIRFTRIGAVADPALVVGSYPDPEAGRLALRAVRRNGFRRAAAIHGLPGGRTVVEDNDLPRLWGAIGGGVFALAVVVGYLLQLARTGAPRDATEWLASGAFVAVGAVTGWALSRWLDLGVRDSVLKRYRRWVTAGETLVIVEVQVSQARSVLDLLRESEDALPATFIIRPHSVVPGRVVELQRRERFAGERLKLHATWLAGRHAGALRARRPQPLWNRLSDGERIIDTITLDLAQAVQLEQSISVAAEWLLDNAYVIQRQIADVRGNLSHQLYEALPTLEVGPRYGEPRAYDLAAELVAHVDADLAEEDVVDFLIAYQQVSPLAMSEIWALPLLLRLALLESLSYLATRIDEQQHEFEWAEFWANRLLVSARRTPDRLLAILAELSSEHPDPSTVFADRLIGQLQGESLALGPVLAWLELKWGQPVLDAIQQEERRHVADQATIANGIGSLRLLARLDWRDVFETVSLVEDSLRADPTDIYRRMDFGTRDRYRHVVEEIARRSHKTELEVALAAVALSAAEVEDRSRHVGYALIDAGRPSLETKMGYRATASQRLRLGILHRPALWYVGSIGLITAAVLALLLGRLWPPGGNGAWLLTLGGLGLLALVPASELAVQIVTFVAAKALHPQSLPKLAFEDGVPDEWRTLVVIPTLLVSPDSIRENLARLEIHHLADRDANLRFALLADLVDAPERDMPPDAALIDAAIHGVDLLNDRYAGDRFTLFFRPRRWSETERCWMGWERKRGKLEELNAWLLGEAGGLVEAMRPIAGQAAQLQNVGFVITLDADTQLPYGTAKRLVGTLAHPLNRPRLAAGWAAGRRRLYHHPTSREFQPVERHRLSFRKDLCRLARRRPLLARGLRPLPGPRGEGSYYGKGIYDVATFHRVLGGRFPSATLLSHDLLEGAYVRVGMATDVELFDSFPRGYLAETQRQHRWVRGDWQIAAWGGVSVPAARGGREPNPLGALDRWKILDNLRRSLVPVASVALLAVALVCLARRRRAREPPCRPYPTAASGAKPGCLGANPKSGGPHLPARLARAGRCLAAHPDSPGAYGASSRARARRDRPYP